MKQVPLKVILQHLMDFDVLISLDYYFFKSWTSRLDTNSKMVIYFTYAILAQTQTIPHMQFKNSEIWPLR